MSCLGRRSIGCGLSLVSGFFSGLDAIQITSFPVDYSRDMALSTVNMGYEAKLLLDIVRRVAEEMGTYEAEHVTLPFVKLHEHSLSA